MLDLGCGPGTLAIPLAQYAGEVVAVDVEPEMITEVSRLAPPNVTVVHARAEDVDEGWGSFRLATAGRAFHWFDAPLVLDHLARLSPTLALCADHLCESQSLALELASELIDEPPVERPIVRYADLLAGSPFSKVEVLSVEVERTWTPDGLIGFVYSTSTTSIERLKDRRDEFERRIRERLGDTRVERVGVDAVVGRLPS